MKYELVEHTADIAVRVRGRDLGELAQNLAWTVCDLLADAARVGTGVEEPVELRAPDREALLVALANELIYRRDARNILLPALQVEAITTQSLRGHLRGEPAEERHDLRAGLKAATWHELAVTETDGGLELFMVFDV
jgi:SHS2 domain-containing protein